VDYIARDVTQLHGITVVDLNKQIERCTALCRDCCNAVYSPASFFCARVYGVFKARLSERD